MANWNLSCAACEKIFTNVTCSIFDIPSCPDCGGERALASSGLRYVGTTFPFEGRHITPDGKPITIESMHHLRQVEKQYGVVLSAFSKDNIRDVDPIKHLPKYRG